MPINSPIALGGWSCSDCMALLITEVNAEVAHTVDTFEADIVDIVVEGFINIGFMHEIDKA